jgi:hypothetical protein
MFMERVGPVVDATISVLARKRFVVDPIAGEHYSRATSIISSSSIIRSPWRKSPNAARKHSDEDPDTGAAGRLYRPNDRFNPEHSKRVA